ncbi:MAG: hypothetical protein J5I93_30345, partial [Pirellulaceae bacterium]|nr:hypothetical protein [Pirellulaceae bacterium]
MSSDRGARTRMARKHPRQWQHSRRRLTLEHLEPRQLLASDFVFDAEQEGLPGFELILASDSLNLHLRDAAGRLVKSQALADNSGRVTIRGSSQPESLTIDASLPDLQVTWDAGLGADRLRGPQTDSRWQITGENTGTLNDRLSFTGVEYLIGAADNQDTFVLEPNGLLAGGIDGNAGGFDTLILSGGEFETVQYAARSTDAGTIWRDGVAFDYAGLEPIHDATVTVHRVVGLSAADDPDAVLSASPVAGFDLRIAGSTFESIDFLNPSGSLTVRGLAGNDFLTVASLDPQFNADLTIESERILVAAGAVIDVDGTGLPQVVGNVTLRAAAEHDLTSSSSPAPIDLRAEVLVLGTIIASGQVTIAAEVNNRVAVQLVAVGGPAAPLAITSASSAIARLGSTASVQAGTLEVTARTIADLSAELDTASAGTVSLGSSLQPIAHTTHALIDGGAQITVGSGPLAIDQPASLLVQAIDASDLQTRITTGTIAAADDVHAVSSELHFSRDTQATIGAAGAEAVLSGPAGSATGLVKLRAENRSGPAGGLQGTIASNFLGVHTTHVSRDNAVASVHHATMNVSALDVSAANSTAFLADAKRAENNVSGRTSAELIESRVTASPASGDQGVSVSATDRSSYAAHSGQFQAEADDLVAAFPSGLDLARLAAVNQVNKDTLATIRGASHTLTVVDGDVQLQTLQELQVSSTADAMTITDTSNLLPAFNLRMGGVLATNEVRGDVRATLDGGTVVVSGTAADILIDARNASAIDSRTEATTASAGGSNAVAATAVALNAVGWDIHDMLAATLDTLIGTTLGATEDTGGAEAAALVIGTAVTAGGNLTVTADSSPQLNATVSNVADSTGAALYGASGVSVAGIVAGNLASSRALAIVRDLPAAHPMSVGDALLVQADDGAGVYANSKLVSSQVTTNTGGVAVLNDAAASQSPATYATDNLVPANALKSLNFGDTVRLGNRFDKSRGKPGRVYVYLGQGGGPDDARNLLDEDYTNLDYWKEQVETRVLNNGLNLSNSNSAALGGLVVRNIVAGGAEAALNNADVTAGSVTVQAHEQATLQAIADATATSSGGSAFGQGTSLAAQGVIAVNVMLGQTQASIVDSQVTTTFGPLLVEALNSSQLGARTTSAVNSGADAIGVVLAFNTIGYEAQNLLSDSFDALLAGSALGDEQPAQARAFIRDSAVRAAGDVTVSALSRMELEAYVGSDATSAAAALFGASAMSFAGVLASNKVSSSSDAFIESTSGIGQLDVTGHLLVNSRDDSLLNAATNLVAVSSRVNDLGASIVNDLVRTLTSDYKYTSHSGQRPLAFGDMVRLDDVDHTTNLPVQTVHPGDWVQLADDVGGGTSGQVYEYLGVMPLSGTTPAGNIDFHAQDFTDTNLWREILGTAGSIYQYMGQGGRAEDTRDLASEDFTDFERWKQLAQHNVIPSPVSRALLDNLGLSAGSAQSLYALVSRNDLSTSVDSHIEDMRVRAGGDPNGGPASVTVSADLKARLKATDNSVISASSKSGGGAITSNQLRGTADAYLERADVRTASGSLGDVTVTAINAPTLDAISWTSSKSEQQVGVVFAFNTIGWDASNIFLQAFDAILGDNFLTSPQPAHAHARLLDSVVVADGDLTVWADSSAQLHATTGNEQQAEATNTFVTRAKFGFDGLAASGILASNKVSSDAKAWIDFTPSHLGPRTVTAGGTLEVTAIDTSSIMADTTLVATAVSTNNLDAFNDVAIALGLDDYEFTTASGNQSVGNGNRVRLGANYQGPAGADYGDPGSVYEYLGDTANINLSQENFGNAALWSKVTLGLDDARLNVGNLSDSDARAFGGLIVLNDVRGNVAATVDRATLRAAEVIVSATQNASLQARAESTVAASGGSAWGSGTVIAVNGQIVTNLVQAQADARVTRSDLATSGGSGNIKILSENTSGIDATILSSTDTGDTGVGITLAFNTLGWESQNLLFHAVDALIGDPLIASAFGDEATSRAHAVVSETPLHAAGALQVTARNAAQLNATVSNAARSAAAALFNAGGMSVGGTLASNKVSTSAQAYIDNSGLPPTPAQPDIRSGGQLTVTAEDETGLFANVKLVSSSITTNDGGAKVLNEALADALPVRFVSSEGQRNLKFGDRVRLADNHSGGGNAGSIYEYLGAGGHAEDQRDLAAEDYSNTDYWNEALETRIIPQGYNLTDSNSNSVGGMIVTNELRSEAFAYITRAAVRSGGDLSVRATEDATLQATNDSFVESSGGSVFGKGDSLAANGTIATNVLLAKADAWLRNSDVATSGGGDVVVAAANTSRMTADTLAATQSGADAFSVLLAFNSLGWESNSLLFNSLDALLGLAETEFDHQQTETLTDGLKPDERVKLDAGGIYRYVGDALTGTVDLSQQNYSDTNLWQPVFAAFGRETPARAQAYVVDTPIHADGEVLVTADSSAQLTSNVSNDATSKAAAFFGASALSASGVLASNKVSSLATSYIDFTGGTGTVQAGGGVAVTANDGARMDASTSLGSSGTKKNDLGASILNDLYNKLTGEYRYSSKSGTQPLAFGDMVRVASDYALPAGAVDESLTAPGKLFQYMGAGGRAEDLRDLGAEDYSNYGLWKEITQDNLIPSQVTDAALRAFKLSLGKGRAFYGLVARNDVQGKVVSYLENTHVDAGGTVRIAADESARLSTNDSSTVQANNEAAGGSITTNQLQAQALAYLRDSDVTATSGGDVVVDARNVAELIASSQTQSKADSSVGVVVAFNTVGWNASNLLFQAFDALLGDDILTGLHEDDQDGARAFIENSAVSADGDVHVRADASGKIQAVTGNEQTSRATNALVLEAKQGKTGMSASGTLASSKVRSQAQAYIDNGHVHTVRAGGEVAVEAKDEARIDASTKVVTSAITTNDLSAIATVLGNLLPNSYSFTTASGVQRLSNALPNVSGDLKTEFATRVRAGADYDSALADPGAVYKFIGSGGTADLGQENYKDSSRWQKITGGVDDVTDAFPSFGNLSASSARAIGIVIVLNDVRSDVDAEIRQTEVTAREVRVQATENASILATVENNVTALGGSAFKELGEGTVIAGGGSLVTNLVQSQADAVIVDSRITTAGSAQSGHVVVDARNTSGLDATLLTTGASGDTAGSLVLAFNTLGWKSQNVLFNAVDALIGDPLIADAFGNDDSPARAQAYIRNTQVDATGNVTVSADNAARLNATVSNAASSTASAMYDATGKALGGVVSLNRVNSAAHAYIDNQGTPPIPGTALDLRAGGTLTIFAADNSENYANVRLVSSSITTNDGGVGVLTESTRDQLPADFSTSETSAHVRYGQRVRLADGYGNGGRGGGVYEWLGSDADGMGLDLSAQDYSDKGYWKEVAESRLLPQGINMDNSDSMAIGGLVVLNDVRSEVVARLVHAEVQVAAVDVDAVESAVIRATTDSSVESSGGSSFSGEGQSLAVNGTIATNVVLSSAKAFVADSVLATTVGGVAIDASNTSEVDARTLSATTTGAQGVGVTLAFNTLGWKSQNVLFNAIDSLLGDPLISGALGNQQPAAVHAYIVDSQVDSAGGIHVSAVSQARIEATVTNETVSAAYSFGVEGGGASGFAVGVVLAHNMVQSEALAYIDSTNASGPRRRIDARGGGVEVIARDAAAIEADSKLAAISSATNDFGLSLLTQFADQVLGEYQYTDRSGTRDLKTHDQVRLDDVDFTTAQANPDEVAAGNRVEVSADLANGSAAAGDVFEYIGGTPLSSPDLKQQNYQDTARWKPITAAPGGTYRFIADDTEQVDLNQEDFTNTSRWLELTTVDPRQLIPGVSFNVTDSDSAAFGGIFVRNDVRSQVVATIHLADVTAAGPVALEADESATIFARDTSTVTSSGGGTFGGGSSYAINGVFATNLVLSKSNASITDSSIITSDGGDVSLDAENSSKIDAKVTSLVESNGISIGATLAFNTIGIKSQNLLFNAVDTLFGTNIADQQPAEVTAFTRNTTIDAAGGVRASATLSADIDATTENSATAIAASTEGGNAITLGGVLTLNTISTQVEASLDGAAALRARDGDLAITATDSSHVDALVEATSLSIAAGFSDTSRSIGVGLSVARNEIRNDTQALLRNSGSTTAPVQVTGGNVLVSATESAGIQASSKATAVAAAASVSQSSLAVAGGGALAFNRILGGAEAMIESSPVVVQPGAAAGSVTVSTVNSAQIDAVVEATAVSVAISLGGSSPAIAIGASVAENAIGFSSLADRQPLDVTASITNSSVTAPGGLKVQAESTSEVNAKIAATSVAVAGSQGNALALTAAGTLTINRIATDVQAFVDGATSVVTSGAAVEISATDKSRVIADGQAVAVSAAFSTGSAVSLAIGLSLAFNTIDNEVAAYLQAVNSLLTQGGNVQVTATDESHIDARTIAAALALGAGVGGLGVAFAGGGAVAENVVLTTTDAFIQDSNLGSALSPVGSVDLDASSRSTISALVPAVAASVAVGSTTGVGVSIGIAVARNFVGHDLLPDGVAHDVLSDANPTSLVQGTRVKIKNGPLGGDVYRYLGPTITDPQGIDLDSLSYGDRTAWEQVNLRPAGAGAQAFIMDSSIVASGALTLDADGQQAIDAVVVAGSVAVAGGGTTGVGISGAGAYAENKIASRVKAFVDGDGATGITVQSARLIADDASSVRTIAGAASLAGALGGTAGVSIAVGLGIALNEVANEVAAYIENADQHFTSTSGHVTLSANSQGRPLFQLSAGELSAAGLTFADLDDAAQADQDNPDTPANEAEQDAAADQQTLSRLRTAFAAKNVILADEGLVSAEDGLRISSLDQGQGWSLLAPDGATYILKKDEGTLRVSRGTIDAIAASASLAAGFGLAAGVAV